MPYRDRIFVEENHSDQTVETVWIKTSGVSERPRASAARSALYATYRWYSNQMLKLQYLERLMFTSGNKVPELV